MKRARIAVRVAEQTPEQIQPLVSPDVTTAAMIFDTFVHGSKIPIAQSPLAVPVANEPIVYADQKTPTPEIPSMPVHDCTACAAVATCSLLNFATSSERNPIKERIDAIRQMTAANPDFFNQFDQGERETLIREHIEATRLPIEPTVQQEVILENTQQIPDESNKESLQREVLAEITSLDQPESKIVIQESTEIGAISLYPVIQSETTVSQSTEQAVEISPQTNPPVEVAISHLTKPQEHIERQVEIPILPINEASQRETLIQEKPITYHSALYEQIHYEPLSIPQIPHIESKKGSSPQSTDILPTIAQKHEPLPVVPGKKVATHTPEVGGGMHAPKVHVEAVIPHTQKDTVPAPNNDQLKGADHAVPMSEDMTSIKNTVITIQKNIHHLPRRMNIYSHGEYVLPHSPEPTTPIETFHQEKKQKVIENSPKTSSPKKEERKSVESNAAMAPLRQEKKKTAKKKGISFKSLTQVFEPHMSPHKVKAESISINKKVILAGPAIKEIPTRKIQKAKQAEIIRDKQPEKKTRIQKEKKKSVDETVERQYKEKRRKTHVLKPIMQIQETGAIVQKYLKAMTPIRTNETYIALKTARHTESSILSHQENVGQLIKPHNKPKEVHAVFRVEKKVLAKLRSILNMVVEISKQHAAIPPMGNISEAHKTAKNDTDGVSLSQRDKDTVSPEELLKDDHIYKYIQDTSLIQWYVLMIYRVLPNILFNP